MADVKFIRGGYDDMELSMKIFIYSLIAIMGFLITLLISLFTWQSIHLNRIGHGPALAQAVIAKPPLSNQPGTPANPEPLATSTPAIIELITPTEEVAADSSPTPLPTDTDIPLESSSLPVSTVGSGRWIDVDLSRQMVYAYEDNTLVNSFLVSTGVADTPTVTGQYRIYVKYHHKDMSGPGYYLPDVPFIMYFFEGYGFHGTYWHNNFGTPMSRGCVNLSMPDSEWLYNFASVGTWVNIHY